MHVEKFDFRCLEIKKRHHKTQTSRQNFPSTSRPGAYLIKLVFLCYWYPWLIRPWEVFQPRLIFEYRWKSILNDVYRNGIQEDMLWFCSQMSVRLKILLGRCTLVFCLEREWREWQRRKSFIKIPPARQVSGAIPAVDQSLPPIQKLECRLKSKVPTCLSVRLCSTACLVTMLVFRCFFISLVQNFDWNKRTFVFKITLQIWRHEIHNNKAKFYYEYFFNIN